MFDFKAWFQNKVLAGLDVRHPGIKAAVDAKLAAGFTIDDLLNAVMLALQEWQAGDNLVTIFEDVLKRLFPIPPAPPTPAPVP